jgi:hypothetical protein
MAREVGLAARSFRLLMARLVQAARVAGLLVPAALVAGLLVQAALAAGLLGQAVLAAGLLVQAALAAGLLGQAVLADKERTVMLLRHRLIPPLPRLPSHPRWRRYRPPHPLAR